MKTITTAVIAVVAVSFGVGSWAKAAEESFVGKWKMDMEKSQLSGLVYKVEDAGNNHYKFVFGDDVENVIMDGKDHPTNFGSTWAVSKSGANVWKWTTKKDGKVTGNNTWTVSADGKTSTYSGDSIQPDGTTSHDETKLSRSEGGAGLVGTWTVTETKLGEVPSFELQKWQADGYTMMNPAFKSHTDFKLDGKDYTPNGPRVAPGTTVSGKKLDATNMELTYKVKGKLTETDHYVLSADGKTLTDTVTYPGVSKKEVDVFERE